MDLTKEEKRILFEQIMDIREALEDKIPLRYGSKRELDDLIIKYGGRSRLNKKSIFRPF